MGQESKQPINPTKPRLRRRTRLTTKYHPASSFATNFAKASSVKKASSDRSAALGTPPVEHSRLSLGRRRGAAEPTKLAIFDIDGTIFRSSLVIELTTGLVEAGVFTQKSKKEMEKEFVAWLDRKGTYEAYINKVVKIYIKYISGSKFLDVNRVAQKVIKYQKDRVYRFTRGLIKNLKKQNYFLVAISGSPSYIVKEYAQAIGFDLFFGTELELQNGIFTGKVLNLDSAFHKSKIVKQLVKKYPTINLKKSVAVGDTESDVAMLSLVGNPIAFNPNLQLTRVAKRKGWKVIVERKDAIFHVKDFSVLNIKN